jgi:hypothetical protein
MVNGGGGGGGGGDGAWCMVVVVVVMVHDGGGCYSSSSSSSRQSVNQSVYRSGSGAVACCTFASVASVNSPEFVPWAGLMNQVQPYAHLRSWLVAISLDALRVLGVLQTRNRNRGVEM